MNADDMRAEAARLFGVASGFAMVGQSELAHSATRAAKALTDAAEAVDYHKAVMAAAKAK